MSDYVSKYGIKPGDGEQPTQGSTQRSSMPTCNRCRSGEHSYCPTAITRHTSGDFSSDFECRCYHEEPDMHANEVEDRDAEWAAERGRW